MWPDSTNDLRFWFARHQDALILVALGLALYMPRAGELSIRGEESRRICIAREMVESGNWIVLAEQGKLMTERPPLCNWLIAASLLVAGSDSAAVVRWPSILATIATALLVFSYSRTLMTRWGAFVAGVAWLTMAQVLQIGRLAENEAVMTLAMGASLLGWECGYRCRWPAWQTWCAGYGCAALATLSKGIQGPIYFGAAVGLHLILRRDWKYLFTRDHALGFALFVLMLGAWQVPYAVQVGLAPTIDTWLGEALKRTNEVGIGDLLAHLVAYPFEILGSMLPWSLWLAAFALRSTRQSLGKAQRRAALFLVGALGITFPSVWLAAGARARYFMPMYPCLIPLLGMAIEQAYFATRKSPLHRAWRLSLSAAAAVACLAGVASTSVGIFRPNVWPAADAPRVHALAYAVIALGAAAIIFRSARVPGVAHARRAMLAIAVFLGATYLLPVTDGYVRSANDIAGAVARLKSRLPFDVELVSIDTVYHPFRYYYHAPIRRLTPARARNARFEFFCINRPHDLPLTLNFDWDQIDEVSCDRNAHTRKDTVVIGRRL